MFWRWKGGEGADKDLADCVLVAMFIIVSSKSGSGGAVAVAVDLHLVIFCARLFQITGSRIDEDRRGAASLIVDLIHRVSH